MAQEKDAKHQASSFKVTFKGLGEPLHFLQVSGLDMSVGIKEVSGTSNSQGPVLVRDRRVAGRITLSKGSGTLSSSIQKWLNDSLNPDLPLTRHDVEIVVVAPDKNKELRKFTLRNGFPFSWSGPFLNTEQDGLTIDHISIGFETMTQEEGGKASSSSSSSQVSLPTLSGQGKEAKFYCQPIGLKIRHAGEYRFLAGPGMERPRPDFSHGRQRVLVAQLVADWDLFSDKASSKDSIYKLTDTIQGFLKPMPETLEPPEVTFTYGLRKFVGFLAELDVTVEKFSSDGYPLRVIYNIGIVESFEAPAAESENVF